MDYPELKRSVASQAARFDPTNILIEDKASGTQLIQELIREGVCGVKRYKPTMDKIMRMHSVTTTFENGFVYVPQRAEWLDPYIHELTSFPYGKHDDQADSTSQALDWMKKRPDPTGLRKYYERQAEKFGLGYSYPREANPTVIINDTTGQKLRWNGHCWVDFTTGEPYKEK